MKMQIVTIDNGWLVKCSNDHDDNFSQMAFTFDDECPEEEARKNEIDTMISMLKFIDVRIGPGYDGFSKYNIRISTEFGDEIDDEVEK